MKMIDIMLKQVEENTKSKCLIRDINDKVKHKLENEMSDEDDEIDLCSDQTIETITYMRSNVIKQKHASVNLDILRKMLVYQRSYYRLNKYIDKQQMQMFTYYMLHHEEVYNELSNAMNSFQTMDFNLNIDISNPLSANVNKIKNFSDALQIAVKSAYKMINYNAAKECKGIMPILIFHQEVIGNEEKWNVKIDKWFAYLQAYKLHYVAGYKKAEVIKTLHKSPTKDLYLFDIDLNQTNTDKMSRATHKLDRLLNHAKKLIASAAKGTFPY